jgi:hypothetical protein
MTFAGLPVDGKEDSLDLAFFKRHTLPLVKAAIHDYLQSDSVETIPTIGAGTLRYGTLGKVGKLILVNLIIFLERPNPIPGSAGLSPPPLHAGQTRAGPDRFGGEFG